MAMSADYRPIIINRDLLFPGERGAGTFAFYLSESALRKIKRNGPRWKYYNAKLLREAIQNPLAVFEGLKRKEFEEGYCYTSKPERRWNNERKLMKTPDQRLFLVFLRKEYGLIVFDWEFRVESPGRPGHPVNAAADFEDCIWTRQ